MQLYPVKKQTSEPPFWRLIVVAILVGLLIVAVGLMLKRLGAVEMPLSQMLNVLHHGFVGKLADTFYHYVGPVFAIAGTILITAIIAVVTRSLKAASTFAFTIAATWLPVGLLKTIIDRPRPDAGILPYPFHPAQIDGSFPSGHAAFITALVIALFFLATTLRAKIAIAIIGGAFVLAGASLLAISGVHYASDVTASIIWALAFAPLVHAFWVRVCLPRLSFIK